ncbi:hypothetical protein MSAN_00814800 [Mycena sanguinolenta]|uniref:Protein kinase domain-containing protein n=1 Tax=Mycena sanguinolenta TaxID=230812 RepID=A0A8H6YUS8_9AGAR|nr:hypothetical protein MSAN_00814800 [Mycena sanguinolenta]
MLLFTSSAFQINGGNFYDISGDMNIHSTQPTIEQGDSSPPLDSGLNPSSYRLSWERHGRQVEAATMVTRDLDRRLLLHDSDVQLPAAASASSLSVSTRLVGRQRDRRQLEAARVLPNGNLDRWLPLYESDEQLPPSASGSSLSGRACSFPHSHDSVPLLSNPLPSNGVSRDTPNYQPIHPGCRAAKYSSLDNQDRGRSPQKQLVFDDANSSFPARTNINTWEPRGCEIGTSSFLPLSLSMDLQLHSDPELSLVSTDNAAVHPGVVSAQASRFTRHIKLFVNPFSFLSSFFRGPRVNPEFPKPTGNHTRSDSEKKRRFIAAQTADRLVTNNYYISGGVGGAGGIGRDQGIGGGGGAGHGPTLNFYTPPQGEQSEFRTIRLGDIMLRKEIRPESPCGVVEFQNRSSPGAVVWRVYSGEIRGDPGPEWRQDVAKYAAIRHPYIMQLYGVVSTATLRAMVFHDGADQQWDDVGVD